MSTAKVYEAIARVMADVAKAGIAKTNENQQQRYKFRGIDDVYNALAGALSRNGLVVLPRVLSREVTERATKAGSVLFYVCLDVEYDFVSVEDGSKHTIRVVGEAMDSADKATNKAMSAAYKYACIQAFCIPTEGENDADAVTHQPVATVTQQQADQLRGMLRMLDASEADFCTACRIGSLEELQAPRFAGALKNLNAKLSKAQSLEAANNSASILADKLEQMEKAEAASETV